MKKFNTSKVIVFATGLFFIFQLIMANFCALTYRDTSIFIYSIPSTGAAFTVVVAFYMNKSKMENVLKIKIAFTKFKLKISKLISPEAMTEVENEFMGLERAVDMKIENTVNEAIQEDISSTGY